MKSTQPVPFEATHPGTLINDEIKERHISQKELALELGVLPTFLNEIIKGKRSITADFAILLEKSLEIPADYWMRFQAQYDIDRARVKEKTVIRVENIEKWQKIKSNVPVKYLRKLNLLSNEISADIQKVKDIYNVGSVDDIFEVVEESMAYYRKSEKFQIDHKNMLAWSKIAEFEASKLVVKEYDSNKIADLKGLLSDIFYENKDVLEKVKNLFSKYGIKLILIQKFEKTPIDGYSFWSGDNPAIALTLRYKRIDNFAFTLMHELGHVEIHLSKEQTRKFINIDGDTITDENVKQADVYAKSALISTEKWSNFITTCSPYRDTQILDFCKKNRINPAIVLGRLCYEQNKFAIKSEIDKAMK